jgi:Ca2+-transporting ATPase
VGGGVVETIETLRILGIHKQVLLSACCEEATEFLAKRLGLERWHARMTPEGKAAIIKEVHDEGHLVMAVGSSRQDEPAMAAADFSLALGAPLAAADMYAAEADPGCISHVFGLAKQAREIYRQNLLLTRAGNLIGIGLAFLKIVDEPTAMFGQKILSLILLSNAGRLRWVELRAETEMGRLGSQAAATRDQVIKPDRSSLRTGNGSGHQAGNGLRDGNGHQAGNGPRDGNRPRDGSGLQAVQPSELPKLELPALMQVLQVSPDQGLPSAEVDRRLLLYRQNVLIESEPPRFWSRFREQLSNQIVRLLTGAAVVNAFLGHMMDAISILGIVAVNALLGAVQDSRAEQSIRALRSMQVPVASVVRDGVEQEIPAATLVPGDVVLLHSGDKTPADLRLISEWDLEVDESALTGESYPVPKSHLSGCSGACLFMGTSIIRGQGRALVFATGLAQVGGDRCEYGREVIGSGGAVIGRPVDGVVHEQIANGGNGDADLRSGGGRRCCRRGRPSDGRARLSGARRKRQGCCQHGRCQYGGDQDRKPGLPHQTPGCRCRMPRRVSIRPRPSGGWVRRGAARFGHPAGTLTRTPHIAHLMITD